MRIEIIIKEDHLAVLDPPVPELESVLTYEQRLFEKGGPTGWRDSVHEVTMCTFDLRGRLVFPAGLLNRVRAALGAAGHTVAVQDLRQHTLEIAAKVFGKATPCQQGFLEAMRTSPLGQIEVASRDQVIARCVLAARAFPAARIVFAVPTRKMAWVMRDRLRARLKEPIGLATGNHSRRGTRCLVCTFGGIDFRLAGEFDLVLLPTGEKSLGERAVAMLVAMRFPRIYGFVIAGHRYDWLQRLALEALAGPVIASVMRPRAQLVTMFAEVPAHSVKPTRLPLQQKRRLYWRNVVRNKRITEVCKALSERNTEALVGLGLDRINFMALSGDQAPRVAVLVESHALGDRRARARGLRPRSVEAHEGCGLSRRFSHVGRVPRHERGCHDACAAGGA